MRKIVHPILIYFFILYYIYIDDQSSLMFFPFEWMMPVDDGIATTSAKVRGLERWIPLWRFFASSKMLKTIVPMGNLRDMKPKCVGNCSI